MDERLLLLLRALGYLLNAAIFAAVAIKFRHHWRVLGAWVLWCLVVVVAVLFRATGELGIYFFIVDYVTVFLLYLNAVLGAWVLLKHEPKKK